MAEERTKRARDLRRTTTRPEQMIWEILRAHRMQSAKFRRQHPIGPFFADFACLSKKIVIEVDGEHHGRSKRMDGAHR